MESDVRWIYARINLTTTKVGVDWVCYPRLKEGDDYVSLDPITGSAPGVDGVAGCEDFVALIDTVNRLKQMYPSCIGLVTNIEVSQIMNDRSMLSPARQNMIRELFKTGMMFRSFDDGVPLSAIPSYDIGPDVLIRGGL